MTNDEFPHTWRGRIIEIGKLAGASASIAATITAFWMFTAGPIREFLNLIDMIREEQVLIWEEIGRLADGVARATGEDRVIREQPGQTYVSEPVYQGERVRFNMVAERTRLGAACTLIRTVPMFTDETRIPQPGPAAFPNRQIVGQGATFLQPVYEMPDTLQPGRVSIYLILEYECPAGDTGARQQVLDRTTTAVFRLLPGERPASEEGTE